MPRTSRRERVAERAAQIQEEQAERRREAARRGAETRRQRREQVQCEAQPDRQGAPSGERRTRANLAQTRRAAKPRKHPDMLTVALRGPLATRMRAIAESLGMSLAALLQDALLLYEEQIQSGYEAGQLLRAATAAGG